MARAALTPLDRAAYLKALDHAADAATPTGGDVDLHLRVAERPVRLRFAGQALVDPVTRALAHLRVPPTAEPQLTIRLWASDALDPPSAWSDAADGTVRGPLDGDGGFFQWDGGSLIVLDAARDRGWFWISTAADGSGPDRAAPLSAILRPWLAQRGVQLVHAAAVGDVEGCVLLVGGPGAGKSTAVLACLAAGLGCVGDDTCLIGPDAPPTVSSLYNTVQAEGAALAGLPFLDGGPSDGDRKKVGFLRDDVLLAAAPLRAIAVLGRTDRPDTRVRPATPREALTTIGPTSILRMPGPAQGTLSRLARVLERAPCHHLELGTDPDGVARAVQSLL